MKNSTQALVSAVNLLPELTERKKIIDKHTNIATVLLNQIKARSLDAFCMLEEEFFTRTADSKALLQLLNDQSKGSSEVRSVEHVNLSPLGGVAACCCTCRCLFVVGLCSYSACSCMAQGCCGCLSCMNILTLVGCDWCVTT